MIGARLWRRRRSQRVTTAPVVFTDIESPSDVIDDAGATLPSLPPGAPRPSYVHRFSRDPFNLVADLLARGMGGGKPPIEQAGRRPLTWLSRKRGVVVGPRLRFPLVRSPESRRRVAESWSEFNRLRLDPRTSVCLRRRARREVLFARKVAGRRGLRNYRRNETSSWSC